jgi:dethiobiotin synthetase
VTGGYTAGVLRVVVLGTGTGVGKTFVTTALARAIGRQGRVALAVKPIETGRSESGAPYADSAALEAATFGATPPRPHPLYGFERGVSPHLAARADETLIRLFTISKWLDYNCTTLPYDAIVLVETAGAVFSPLNPQETNLDLAQRLEPATWLLVAPDNLGVLHDVTATLAAMTARARAPDFVVLSAARAPDASTGSNAAELEGLGIARCAAVLGRDDPGAADPLARALGVSAGFSVKRPEK